MTAIEYIFSSNNGDEKKKSKHVHIYIDAGSLTHT